MASPKTSRGLSDNCGSRWLTTISRCHIAVSASHYQSLSQREAQDRGDVGNRSLQPWRLDLRIMSGRRLHCCPIAFLLTFWMPYPTWSVFTHHLRKLITAVEAHYQKLSVRALLNRSSCRTVCMRAPVLYGSESLKTPIGRL